MSPPPPPFTSEKVKQVLHHVPPPDGWYAEVQATGVFTLVFVVEAKRGKILLGRKKRGFGLNIINGFGGKPLPGESMLDCASRELHEECLIHAVDIVPRGRVAIYQPAATAGLNQRHGRAMIDIHIYLCTKWSGEPRETDEMAPAWYETDDLPYDQMWPEARLHLPALLKSDILARIDYEEDLGKDKMVAWWIASSDHTNA